MCTTLNRVYFQNYCYFRDSAKQLCGADYVLLHWETLCLLRAFVTEFFLQLFHCFILTDQWLQEHPTILLGNLSRYLSLLHLRIKKNVTVVVEIYWHLLFSIFQAIVTACRFGTQKFLDLQYELQHYCQLCLNMQKLRHGSIMKT